MSRIVDLTSGAFKCAMRKHSPYGFEHLALDGAPCWLSGAQDSAFAVYLAAVRITGAAQALHLRNVRDEKMPDGRRHVTICLEQRETGLAVEDHTVVARDIELLERWVAVRNTAASPLRIDRIDSIVLDLRADTYDLLHFTGAWGQEFEPIRTRLAGPHILQSRAGRSSHGDHPWFTLFRGDGATLSASVMWSGNWVLRFEPIDGGGWRLSGGLHDWQFHVNLGAGETIEGPHVALALGLNGDLNRLSMQYHRAGRRYWYARNSLATSLPLEWNHWWSYEDSAVSEDRFLANVDSAADLGLDLCTLDAGWFGPSDPAANWRDHRGDWDLVNAARFPGGIRVLSNHVHDRGLRFGLWCEIEALGPKSRLGVTNGDLAAEREGNRLGYVCFGNPAAQEWAFQTLCRLIEEYCCDWIKLDFNIDPGAGCDRTDHGHDSGDGLYRHYQGYYEMLDRVRARYPNVVLENCSSGGLRVDLAMLRHTHVTFLSDPDWPEHALQVFWGATTMLAPNVCLRWSWSEWLHAHPHQEFDPRDLSLRPQQIDFYIRISMLGVPGFSLRLPDLPSWIADRIAANARVYRDSVRRFVRDGDFYRLTQQPMREGGGDRWAAFQYSLPDESLVFVFRLSGGPEDRTIFPYALDPERMYSVTDMDSGNVARRLGQDILDTGLRFSDLAEEGSAILLIQPLLLPA